MNNSRKKVESLLSLKVEGHRRTPSKPNVQNMFNDTKSDYTMNGKVTEEGERMYNGNNVGMNDFFLPVD